MVEQAHATARFVAGHDGGASFDPIAAEVAAHIARGYTHAGIGADALGFAGIGGAIDISVCWTPTAGSDANQTGVRTLWPFLRKVSRFRYLWGWSEAKLAEVSILGSMPDALWRTQKR